ncbi:ankyrin repeat protein [Acanthamoeba polyphaga moumouvirus]|uniref:Ankyrin repeat protein n=2 Tax=Moumouvirus TaxID=3080801 RepID=L7RBZ1_9VIRU|nr:ankyrin repeat protein [Acanthamoeba polyphaga moumouvirus]AEX63148.1 hypothetical protein mv_L946 [Moumouvirus Monve]AGC01691.1 ankyrin repeat protein [Acanthamoeba polyphaga moumouvirus]AQN68029.1 ankyrin repeat protein [Saudi moumouvirus]
MEYNKLDEINKYFNKDLFSAINLNYDSVKIYKYLYENKEYEYIDQCKNKCFRSLLYFSMRAYESIINTDSIYQFITGNANCIDDLAICLLSAHVKRNDLILLLQSKGFDFSIDIYHNNDNCFIDMDNPIKNSLYQIFVKDPVFNYISRINIYVIKELIENGLKYNYRFNLSNFISNEIIQIFLDFDFFTNALGYEDLLVKYLCQNIENISDNIVNQIISKGISINNLIKNQLSYFVIEIFDYNPSEKINLLIKYDFTHFDRLLVIACIHNKFNILEILFSNGYELNEECIGILIKKHDINILNFLIKHKINLSTYYPKINNDKLFIINKLEELGLNKDIFSKIMFDNLYCK